MNTLTLNVQPRETGKKAVKATRNAGLVPGVLYGAHQEPVHFAAELLDPDNLHFVVVGRPDGLDSSAGN